MMTAAAPFTTAVTPMMSMPLPHQVSTNTAAIASTDSATGNPFRCGAGMLEDPEFSLRDKHCIALFRQEIDRRLAQHGKACNHSMFSICEATHIDLTLIPKDGHLMVALWVTLLSAMSSHSDFSLSYLKYPTFISFQEAYPGCFATESNEERNLLWHTANWMHILFQIIPAKKNKGLAMQVIPKLIEGWDSKYVTGSGQTRLTANRVHIFEQEGNTKASHRGGKSKTKKKAAHSTKKYGKAGGGVSKKLDHAYDAYHSGKRRKRRSSSFGKKSSTVTTAHSAVVNTVEIISAGQPVYIYNYSRSSDEEDSDDFDGDSFAGDEDDDDVDLVVEGDGGHTDVDDDSLNELKCVYEAFARSPLPLQREETMCLELLRSQSALNLDLSPSQLQRGYSWTEIPVCLSSGSNHVSQDMLNSGPTSYSSMYNGYNNCSYYPFTSPVPFANNNNNSSSSSSSSINVITPHDTCSSSSYVQAQSIPGTVVPSVSPVALDPNVVMDIFMGYGMTSPCN